MLPRGYPSSVTTLGDHLRQRRLELGLTQRILGASLGARAETVANWESGRTRPPVRLMAGVIRFLGYDPEPVDPSPASRLRACRRRLGLTQTELASRLGVDEGTVVDLEHGRRRVSRQVVERLERFFAEVVRA